MPDRGNPIAALFWRLKDAEPERLLDRARRAALIARTRASAIWHRVDLELDLAPDLRVGRGVRIELTPRTSCRLRIAERGAIREDVLIKLNGGDVEFGPECELRRNNVVNVAGRLRFEFHNIMSWNCAIHAGESVYLEPFAGAAEHVTIADSTHYFTEPDKFFYDNTRTAPVRIGGNTWLCPKVTVTSGVTVGSHCIIASNSVVTRDIPNGSLASGIPAAVVRHLDLPWERGEVGSHDG